MKKIKCVPLMAGLLILFWAAVTPIPATAQTLSKKYQLEVLGGSSVNYRTSVAIADILSKYSDGRIKASAVETVGSDSNIAMSQEKDPNKVLVSNTRSSYYYAKEGLMDWTDKKITDQRWVFAFQFGDHALVTLNPDLKELVDLKGKTIAILPGKDIRTTWSHIFEKVGIKGEVNIKPMGFMEQYDALSDGLVDASLYLSTHVPGGSWGLVYPLKQLVQKKGGKVYGIPVPPDVVAYINQKLNRRYLALTVPPGTLPTQTVPLGVYSINVIGFTCRADADEELIYLLTKTVVEHYYRLRKYAPFLSDLTPAHFVQLIQIDNEAEIHPGALKYYKKIGLWPDAWNDFQKQLGR